MSKPNKSLTRSAVGIVVLLILVSLFLIVTGTKSDDGNVNTGDETVSKLVLGNVAEVNSVNYFDRGLSSFFWLLTNYGLIRFDKDGEVVPEIAESWETTDFKRWVFHLRNNVTWHDGVSVTSRDFKYSVDFSKENTDSWESIFGNIDSIETPDPYTVIYNLKDPDYNFLTTMAVAAKAVPEHVFEDVADPKRYDDKKALIGTGPYMFDNFDKNAGIITYKAYDQYWRGKPAVDVIEIKLFKNPETMMMALQKGEIDAPYTYAKGVDYYHVPNLMKNDNLGYMIVDSRTLGNVLWINTNHTPLDNKDLRQALSYAINYAEILNLFTAGYGQMPDAGFVPNGTLYYVDTRKLTYDVNKSKSMLDSIGFKDIDGDGFRETPDEKKIVLDLVMDSSKSDQVRLGEIIKKYFASVGMNVELRPLDSSTFWDTMDVRKTFDMGLAGTTFWGMNMGAGYGSGYVATRYYGWSMVNDSRYDAILDGLLQMQDRDKKKVLAADIQEYYAEEMPQIALYSMNLIQPYNKKYEGWTYNVYYGVICPDTFYNLHKA
ncbi:ABC transporter substrate-binding protein [Methanosarcina acetivorans]|uniref:ABC transporter substrate-binding protein n=1 Tax=Methanosarcina acetivorans TaxID=2214 RepID=UPI00064FCCBF|nr:ABC transporter substrate-binding protein [Methanosarcina acetivorans]